MAKYFILIGALFIFIGLLINLLNLLGINLWKLPGDILIKKGNFTLYFPLSSGILISIMLTLLVNILIYFLNK